jgi:hypothetical protein
MGQILTFDEALRVGLRPESYVPRNSQFLDDCSNKRPTPFGLKSFNSINQPFTADYLTNTLSITKTWPFPQIFRGRELTLLVDETAVYTATEVDNGTWTAVQITTYDYYSPATPKAITAGGPWHFMDFGPTWMLFNGVCQVVKTPHHANTFVQDTVTITTGCDFKEGRALMGGFDSSDFVISDWETFLDAEDANAPDELVALIDNSVGAGSNWVWWSTIGGGDLLWLFDKDLMMNASVGGTPDMGYSSDYPYIFDLLRRNECGLRPMPFQGTVLFQKPIGDSYIVYGDQGVGAMTAFSSPVSTMGYRDIVGLGRVGIASRSAAGGDDTTHVFVDESGELWMIESDLTSRRLGFSEFLSPMLDNDIIVSYDPHMQEFHIADGTLSCILNRSGFAKGRQMPTTVSFAQGGIVGITTDIGEPDAVEIITHEFDGGIRGIKELIRVRLATTDTDATGWKVAVDYRFDKGAAWARTAFVTTEPSGIAEVTASGEEFRIVLTHTDETDADLERIEAEFAVNVSPSLTDYYGDL